MRAHHLRALRRAPGSLQGPPAPFSLGPASWIVGEGAWERGARELRAWPGPVGLAGEAALLGRFGAAVSEGWDRAGLRVEALVLPDGVDCCQETLEGLVGRARAAGVGSLAALGGGRVLDLAKLAASSLGIPLATLPTSAATCACATAVAVVNDGLGGYRSVVDLAGPPRLCLVEPRALRVAPPRLLAAGLADTLAKWLEWRAAGEAGAPGYGGPTGAALAESAARVCVDLGAEALQSPASGAFQAALEACLTASAAASCAGKAPAAAAHSLANALSRQGPGKSLLHGEAVGLGLIWQESLLARHGRATMEPAVLRDLLGSWGLPLDLPPGLDFARLARDAWAEGESAHLLGLEGEAGSAVEPLFGGP